MKANKETSELIEMSDAELARIVGGESLLYWLAYGIGSAARLIDGYGKMVTWSSKTMPGLR
jgi:hypothetical protein